MYNSDTKCIICIWNSFGPKRRIIKSFKPLCCVAGENTAVTTFSPKYPLILKLFSSPEKHKWPSIITEPQRHNWALNIFGPLQIEQV